MEKAKESKGAPHVPFSIPADMRTENKRAPSPEPVEDSITCCGCEDGVFGCLSQFATWAWSLLSSCASFLQNLWNPVDPEIAQVAQFVEEWRAISSDAIPAGKNWKDEFLNLSEAAKNVALAAFKSQHHDFSTYLSEHDRNRLLVELADFRVRHSKDADQEKAVASEQEFRDGFEAGLALFRCPCDTAVLDALDHWRQTQLLPQHT